jgi:hypothetical protein
MLSSAGNRVPHTAKKVKAGCIPQGNFSLLTCDMAATYSREQVGQGIADSFARQKAWRRGLRMTAL